MVKTALTRIRLSNPNYPVSIVRDEDEEKDIEKDIKIDFGFDVSKLSDKEALLLWRTCCLLHREITCDYYMHCMNNFDANKLNQNVLFKEIKFYPSKYERNAYVAMNTKKLNSIEKVNNKRAKSKNQQSIVSFLVRINIILM